MKTRLPSTLLLAAFAAVFAGGSAPLRAAAAKSQTDTKIELISAALTARDAGDVAGAQRALAQLEQSFPNDPAVQRLRNEVQASAAARSQQIAAQASRAMARGQRNR